MILKDIELKLSYRSHEDNMVKDFYNPVLSCATSYKRAVGYFTISSLINASQGLSSLIDNGGFVELVVSPKLNEDDINTINLGYKMKDDVILDAMIREFNDIKSEDNLQKLNYIATLIADNRLDIKVAITNDYGAYHEKFGIIEDVLENKIMFTGSMNETDSGQYSNFESFVIFRSWEDSENKFLEEYKTNFENLWNNKTNRLNVIPFPEALKNKFLEYRRPYYKSNNKKSDEDLSFLIDKEYPLLPEWFKPRTYQSEAVEKWKENGYRGLLTMATGTGKTLTGLYGLTELWKEEKKLVSVIVCPYQHLVEQWVDDVKKFNLFPVVCYSKYPNWKNRIYKKIQLLNYGTIDNFTIITTNATFVTNEMQNFLSMVNSEIFLLVDEAHNAGTMTMKKCLDDKYKYRLGLSATPRRFRDEENTEFIFNYFGGEVYSFDLERAISEGYLTRYYYYPHIVRLTEEEQIKYDEYSLKIAQNIKEENGKVIINDIVKNLLIKRSRLIAGATGKISLLRDLMSKYQNKNYILIYCGATKSFDENDDMEIRQIQRVCKILGKEYGMRIRKFTSDESPEERQEIIEMFSDGESLQAIVAIKCLDEGVNIPAIQHAFIMASNSDPKEFIQRRGRVLRLYEGKEFAYIHDFVTIPNTDKCSSLVETELKRVYEFNSLCENKEQGLEFIYNLLDTYDIPLENVVNVRSELEVGGINDEEIV